MNIRRPAILVSALFLAQVAAAETPIGFRVIEKRDGSRTSKDYPLGRPIQIALWYPAAAPSLSPEANRMRYLDYMILGLSERSFAAPSSEAIAQMLGEYRKFLESTGVESAEADGVLATPMIAVRDAAPASGSFPLVLLAPGNSQSADDMASIGERLALHGFRAASVPSPTRLSGPMQSEADIAAKADEQAADLAYAARELGGSTSNGRVGIVGHSFGARSGLLLAMREPAVAAVVSFDGGIGSATGAGQLEKARGFSREGFRAPLLHVYEELDREMSPDLTFIRSLDHSDRWLVRADALHHVHFTTVTDLTRVSPGLLRATSATEDTGPAWDAVMETAISFLDRYVRRAKSPAPAGRWKPPARASLHVEKIAATR